MQVEAIREVQESVAEKTSKQRVAKSEPVAKQASKTKASVKKAVKLRQSPAKLDKKIGLSLYREMLKIRLDNGDLHIVNSEDADSRSTRISFSKLDYEIDIRHLLSSAAIPTRPKQMSLKELGAAIERIRSGGDLSDLDEKNASWYAFETHRRFALPMAPLLFAVLAVALGASPLPGARSWALLVGILVAFAYYVCLAFGGLLAEGGVLEAGFVVWGTKGVFALLGLLALAHTLRNQNR